MRTEGILSDDVQIGIFHGDFQYVAKFFKQPHTYGKLHVERFAPEIMGHVDHFLELMRMFSANLLQCRADDG